jgi:hypothetical protein
MTTRSRLKNALVMAACLIAAGLSSGPANALQMPAMVGHGWPTHNDTCFGSGFAMMTNNCAAAAGTQRLLIIPMQVPQGSFNAFVFASGNGTNTVTKCQGLSINEQNVGVQFTAVQSTTTSSNIVPLGLGTVGVGGLATFHVECSVAQGGGRVVNVVLM